MRTLGKRRNGDVVALFLPVQRSTAEVSGYARLFVGDRAILLDERTLPSDVARLLPAGYGCIRTLMVEWEPFILRAIGRGLL